MNRKEEKWRNEGAAYALRVAKEKGVDAQVVSDAKKMVEASKNVAVGNGYVLDEYESSKDKENDIYYYFGKKR